MFEPVAKRAGMRSWMAGVAVVLALVAGATSLAAERTSTARRAAMPHYEHIFLIIDENKGYNQLMEHPDWTPVIHKLAADYGSATQFYAEVHSSEANYIALLGGDTFGIHDDDAFYCHEGLKDPSCSNSSEAGYANHDLEARSLMDQLSERGMSWKTYMGSIPAPGSLVPRWPSPDYPVPGLPNGLYAAKHNGFVNFKRVNEEPYRQLAQHFVGFGQLDADLASDNMPNYAHIVPNQCDDMHGMGGANVPADCTGSDSPALIRRGDAEIGTLVDKIMQSKVWSDPGHSAIVVTFDENNKGERNSGAQGCCGYDPHSKANFGGGRIVTIVIANHGPRHFSDATPYNHYSLLRTVEDAFGIGEHLGHAADASKGVVSMNPLFAVRN